MIFKPELAERILRGEKTATRRRLSDNPRSPWFRVKCAYEVGQIFAVQPGRGKQRIGDAIITSVYRQALGGVNENDAYAEGFQPGRILKTAREAFVHAWCEINGSYDSAEIVHVIEFELLPESGEGEGR